MNWLTGIDVNDEKGIVAWDGVAGDGHHFAFVKASEGATWRDGRFEVNRQRAAAAGLLVGAYHFARPSRNTPEAEAANFLGALAGGHELPVLDFEDERAHGDLTDWAAKWLNIVAGATGRTPVLYTYAPYWRAHGSNRADLARFPLWIAAYGVTSVNPPAPWAQHTIWQFTSAGSVSGVVGRVDMNRFGGAVEDLRALFGVAPPPPQEDDVKTTPITVKAEHATGRGWAVVAGVHRDQVIAVTAVAGDDGSLVRVGLDPKPALDGDAVVRVDVGTPTLIDLDVRVLVAHL